MCIRDRAQTAQLGYIHGEYLYASPPIETPAPAESDTVSPPAQAANSPTLKDGEASADSDTAEAMSSSAGHRPLWHQSDADSVTISKAEEPAKAEPVSYTHLDVYKRQPESCPR